LLGCPLPTTKLEWARRHAIDLRSAPRSDGITGSARAGMHFGAEHHRAGDRGFP
jgi:hypothetical protein